MHNCWGLVLSLVLVAVSGIEDPTGKDDMDGFDAMLFDTAAPMQQNDPVMSVIGELTAAAQPRAADVVRAVYEAAGENIPSAASFKGSDLGESAGSKEHSQSMAGLRNLLADADAVSPMDRLGSLDELESALREDSVVEKSADHPKSVRSHSDMLNKAAPQQLNALVGPSDKVLWDRAVHHAADTTGKLDQSEDFVPEFLIQMEAHLTPPTPESMKNTVRHIRDEEQHLKRKVQNDMEVAEITSNDADLSRGLKDEQQLHTVDRELKLAKSQERRVDQLAAGQASSRDTLTQISDITQRVERRVENEHLRKVKLSLAQVSKDAYDKKMKSARLMQKYAGTGLPIPAASRERIQKADVTADIAVDKQKAASTAFKAALGEEKEPFKEPFEKKLHMYGTKVDKSTAEKLATTNAKKAETAIEDALLNDDGFDKAATTAQIALQYENVASKAHGGKERKLKEVLQKAKTKAQKAILDALQGGTEEEYMKLRETMGDQNVAKANLDRLIRDRKLEASLKKTKGVEKDPSVLISRRLAEDADATFYRDVKKAERAYGKAADSAKEADVDSAGALVSTEEKSLKESKDNSLQLVKLKTTVAAKHVEQAQHDAEEAIKAEHSTEDDYTVAHRNAWNSITQKEAAQVSSENAHNKLRDAEEELADATATSQEYRDRYHRLEAEKEQARQNTISADAILKSAEEKLRRRETVIKEIRKETSKNIGEELRQLQLEVETLQKTGHPEQAKAAKEQSTLNQDEAFLKREENRELDARMKTIKQESTTDLANKMEKLVDNETSKLQQQIEASAEGTTKSTHAAIDDHSSDLDKRLATLESDAQREVRKKIRTLAPAAAAKMEAQHVAEVKKNPGKEPSNVPDGRPDELGKMFRQVKQFTDANDKREQKKKDDKYVEENTTPKLDKVRRMQSTADKPLAVAEQELKKIIGIEEKVKKAYETGTYEGVHAKEGKAGIDRRFTNAQRAVKLAKEAMQGANTDDELKRANAKQEAAKRLMRKAKLAKIRFERAEVEKKMASVNAAVKRKQSSLKQAEDAAAEALSTLQQSSIKKAKTKILKAQIRHDRWVLDSLRQKVTEATLAQEHEKHNYDELAERSDKAHWSYTKARRIVEGEKKHASKFKEDADATQRRYKTSVKVAHLLDENYRELGQEAKQLKEEARRKTAVMKTRKRDLREQEKNEEAAIMHSDFYPDEEGTE